MVFITCSVGLMYHAAILQNGDLKYFQVATTPVPSDFVGLPYPLVRGYPCFFFIKKTAKDVKLYLYARRQNVRGVVTNPLRKTRVKADRVWCNF